MNGPMLLEVNVGRPDGTRVWVLQQSVQSEAEGLAVASRMSSVYRFRLYVSPSYGYRYLDWQPDPTGEEFSPVWVDTDPAVV